MEFLKKFFNDDSTTVGLCKFESIKPKHTNKNTETVCFFNPFITEKIYETNFNKNILLI